MTKTPYLFEMIEDVRGYHAGVRHAEQGGYAFVSNGLTQQALNSLVTEAAGLTLELGDHIAKPIYEGTKKQITQLHERAYLPVGHPDINVATALAAAVVIRARGMRFPCEPLKHWHPTEAGYQLYRNPDHHISKHRDRRNDWGLSVTATITGRAVVGIHEPIDDPDDYINTVQIDEFVTEPGTLMLLRANGFGNGQQVIHDVSGPLDGPRLILNLRQRADILPSPSEMA